LLVEVTTDAARIVVTNPISSAPESRDERRADDDRGGHGLLGVRERVASVRGTVESGPDGVGYRLAATLPIAADGEATTRHPSPDFRVGPSR
jgi:signal transduction histidine kinase